MAAPSGTPGPAMSATSASASASLALALTARSLYEHSGSPARSLDAYGQLWESSDKEAQHAQEQAAQPEAGGSQRDAVGTGDVLSYLLTPVDEASPAAAVSDSDGNDALLLGRIASSGDGPGLLSWEDDVAPGGPHRGGSERTTAKLVSVHNAALVSYAAGKVRDAATMLLPVFRAFKDAEFIASSGEDVPASASTAMNAEAGDVFVRICFLLLDCALAAGRGDVLGLDLASLVDGDDSTSASGEATTTVDDVLKFVGSYVAGLQSAMGSDGGSNKGGSSAVAAAAATNPTAASFVDTPTELRFRLSLYRSRILFGKQLPLNSIAHDKKTKMARKELKSAMEIYHHKLACDTGSASENVLAGDEKSQRTDAMELSVAAGSVGSDSATAGGAAGAGGRAGLHGMDITAAAAAAAAAAVNSPSGGGGEAPTAGGGAVNASSTPSYADRPPYQQSRLDAQSQCALSLKANLEYLKGNARKALKLTAEAKHAGERRREHLRAQAAQSEGEEKARDGAEADGDGGGDGNGSNSSNESVDRASAIDAAMHHNNLALLHQVHGRCHAAAHYYARALGYLEGIVVDSSENGQDDGNSSMEEKAEKQDGGPETSRGGIPFAPDGTVCNPRKSYASILHNAGMCAFTTGNYVSSYECTSKCVAVDPETFGRRGRVWLRMAEACLGVHRELVQKGNGSGRSGGTVGGDDGEGYRFREDGPDGRRVAIVSDGAADCDDDADADGGGGGGPYRPDMSAAGGRDRSLPPLGGPDDVEMVSANPLPRAAACLTKAVRLCSGGGEYGGGEYGGGENAATAVDADCLESARVALAYVYLELNDPLAALGAARAVLQPPLDDSDDSRQPDNDSPQRRRRRATARMYAAEALCMLDEPGDALEVLLGTGGGAEEEEEAAAAVLDSTSLSSLEALDGVARDLAMASASGPDGHAAATEEKREDAGGGDYDSAVQQHAKSAEARRVEDAKSAVHVTASASAALAGNVRAARAHALRALGGSAVGGSAAAGAGAGGSSSAGGRALARRALLYCLLKEGNTQEALLLLRAGK